MHSVSSKGKGLIHIVLRIGKSSLLSWAVYTGGAYLTIAASNCAGVNESFLNQCGKEEYLDLCFSLKEGEEGKEKRFYGRTQYDHAGFAPEDRRERRTKPPFGNILRSRAWCFQEHFLSVRVLSFGYDEITFDCNGSFICECGEDSSTEVQGLKARHAKWIPSFVPSSSNIPSSYLTQRPARSMKSIWVEVLRECIFRRITVPTNRLPAVSGIARKFQESWHVEYLAGHWNDADILMSLTWFTRAPDHQQATVDYRAPSWSWAVINPPMDSDDLDWALWTDFPGVSSEIYSQVFPENKILGSMCCLATEDPTGAVLGGYLIVQGFCLEVELRYEDNKPYVMKNGISAKEHHFHVNLDRVIPKNRKDVLCWYVGNTGDSDWIYHEMMMLEKKVNKIYQRIGWLQLQEYIGALRRPGPRPRQVLSFLEGYEDCLMRFAII